MAETRGQDAALIAAVQQALSNLGLYTGPIDGRMTPAVQSALSWAGSSVASQIVENATLAQGKMSLGDMALFALRAPALARDEAATKKTFADAAKMAGTAFGAPLMGAARQLGALPTIGAIPASVKEGAASLFGSMFAPPAGTTQPAGRSEPTASAAPSADFAPMLGLPDMTYQAPGDMRGALGMPAGIDFQGGVDALSGFDPAPDRFASAFGSPQEAAPLESQRDFGTPGGGSAPELAALIGGGLNPGTYDSPAPSRNYSPGPETAWAGKDQSRMGYDSPSRSTGELSTLASNTIAPSIAPTAQAAPSRAAASAPLEVTVRGYSAPDPTRGALLGFDMAPVVNPAASWQTVPTVAAPSTKAASTSKSAPVAMGPAAARAASAGVSRAAAPAQARSAPASRAASAPARAAAAIGQAIGGQTGASIGASIGTSIAGSGLPSWAPANTVSYVGPSNSYGDPNTGFPYGYAIGDSGTYSYGLPGASEATAWGYTGFQGGDPWTGAQHGDNYGPATGGGPGDAPSATVLCTYFMRKGRLPKKLWLADMRYSRTLPPEMYVGYRTWADRCIAIMERGGLAGKALERVLWPVVREWATEAAYRVQRAPRGSAKGRFYHAILGSLSLALGRLIIASRSFRSLPE